VIARYSAWLLLAVCIAMVSQASAQQAGRVYRVGVLEREAADSANFSAFRERMRELGYVEGRNLAFEYRSSQGRNGLYPKFAAELAALKVDLILARGTPAIMAAKQATSSIPTSTPTAIPATNRPPMTGTTIIPEINNIFILNKIARQALYPFFSCQNNYPPNTSFS